jgi:hypothetical protein
MYYTKASAFKTFMEFEKSVDELSMEVEKLSRNADSMSPTLIRSSVRRIKRRFQEISRSDVEPYLDMIDGALKIEFQNRAVEAISKLDSARKDLYDLEGSASPSPSPEYKTESSLEGIRRAYAFIKREYLSSDIDMMLDEVKKLERDINKLDFEYLEEGDYDEMLQIKNDISSIKRTLLGTKKSEKYGPYLEAPMRELVYKYSGILNHERINQRAATILDFIEDPERIDLYEPAIKRIMSKKMTAKEFKTFMDSVLTARENMQKFESLKDYTNRKNALS